MSNNLFLILITLGLIARITNLITDDYLTRHLRAFLIRRLGPDHDLTYLVGCQWCASVWVAATIVPIAWYFGHSDAFQIVALIGSFSWLVGAASVFVFAADTDAEAAAYNRASE